ncbi:hypothetical protein F7725_014089 [Dissostichus mawsoni]|uniref:CS domain-containing protein n=1 Tax=Dissostichus mawsoni TaxID=36200 RepID=A0A7J5YX69_DISMA|nr:hypothetical protein F7725_014089 [Dissostichus mawsoni]
MNKITIVRPEESQPARAVWYDRKKYVTVTFIVHKPKDVQVDILPDKMILYCKNDTDDVFYNVLPFYENIQINDSRERVYDRSIHILLRKLKPDYSWPRLQKDEAAGFPWTLITGGTGNEVEDGKEEFDMYADMIKEMSSKNKGEAPDMDDLDFVTSVVSCCPAELKHEVNGKKETLKGFNVKLQDTILFPEGGGQPDDHGLIGDVPVVRVTRQGADAVHFVGSPLEEGQEVQVKVDWERRFDHMQQHSGQHVITALAENMFGYKTTSWVLGRQRSTIELDTPSVKPAQLQALEEAVNEKIRVHTPVTVQLLSIDDPAVEKEWGGGCQTITQGRFGSLISRVWMLTCAVEPMCPTSVIKLLGTEKGKKNKTNLIFLTGNRVLKYAEKSYSTERSLVSLLKTGPDEHVEAVDKLQKSVKLLLKTNLSLLRDMAVVITQNFKNDPQRGNFFSLHKKEGDNEFMNIIANELTTEGTLVFLTVGEEKGPGLFLLAGPSERVAEMGPRVLEMLQGKGAGKNGRFQGKANSLTRRGEVEAFLEQQCKQEE